MKKSTTKNIADILKNTSLNQIITKANSINDLNYKIRQRLPEQYRGLYRIANLVDNTLIIDVQNATIKQGLQLQQKQLLDLIQLDFPDINELSFRVNPNFKS